jgi:hypothetical protein
MATKGPGAFATPGTTELNQEGHNRYTSWKREDGADHGDSGTWSELDIATGLMDPSHKPTNMAGSRHA